MKWNTLPKCDVTNALWAHTNKSETSSSYIAIGWEQFCGCLKITCDVITSVAYLVHLKKILKNQGSDEKKLNILLETKTYFLFNIRLSDLISNDEFS